MDAKPEEFEYDDDDESTLVDEEEERNGFADDDQGRNGFVDEDQERNHYVDEDEEKDVELEEPAQDEFPFDLGADNATLEIEHTMDIGTSKQKYKVIGDKKLTKKLPVLDDSQFDDFLVKKDGEVARLVVVDVANFLHAATPLMFEAGGKEFSQTDIQLKEEQKLDAIYLLQLVRYFAQRDIECCLVTWSKYTDKRFVENAWIIDKFIEEQIVVVVESQNHDDQVMIEIASMTDGVMLSKDNLRDWAEKWREENPRYYELIHTRRMEFLAPRCESGKHLPRRHNVLHEKEGPPEFLKVEDRFSLSSNGHLLIDYELRFAEIDRLHDMIFSTASNRLHELVVEAREGWERPGVKEKFLKKLDRMAIWAMTNLTKQREAKNGSSNLTFR